MHAFSRALTERTYASAKSTNLTKLIASRSVSSTSKNNAATAQQTQEERQEAKAKKMKKAVHPVPCKKDPLQTLSKQVDTEAAYRQSKENPFKDA